MKKLLALVLCIVMIVSIIPTSAYADADPIAEAIAAAKAKIAAINKDYNEKVKELIEKAEAAKEEKYMEINLAYGMAALAIVVAATLEYEIKAEQVIDDSIAAYEKAAQDAVDAAEKAIDDIIKNLG